MSDLQFFGSPSNQIGDFVNTSLLLTLIRSLSRAISVTIGTTAAGGSPLDIFFFKVLLVNKTRTNTQSL
eukprot:768473-Hanusia_phi.AAC.16